MGMIRDFFAARALRFALRRPAPERIPRTLPRAQDVNCFVAQIGDGDEKWPFLADSSDSNGLHGRWWSGAAYDLPGCLSFSSIGSRRIEITHYIGLYEFTHTSPVNFLASELLGVPWLSIAKDKVDQALFNKRRLVRADRINVLRITLEESIRRREFSISSSNLMSLLYSNRWIFHPDKDSLLRYCSFLLGSLASSGDLVDRQGSFTLAPKALVTISEYEEDHRRHRDQLIQQWILAGLTVALVVVGVAQVYVTWVKP